MRENLVVQKRGRPKLSVRRAGRIAGFEERVRQNESGKKKESADPLAARADEIAPEARVSEKRRAK
jgi:hypothetical protein